MSPKRPTWPHIKIPQIRRSEAGSRWLPSRVDFLVPVEALSILFRTSSATSWRARTCSTWSTRRLGGATGWSTRRLPATAEPRCAYLAPYVFPVAIGNHRIVSCEDGIVTFTYRRVGSKRLRKMSLDAMEFLRRFLQHVLPAGFQKVRHYGFLSPNCATSIEAVRSMVTVHNRAKFDLVQSWVTKTGATDLF